MTANRNHSTLRKLGIDLLMLVIFLALISFSIWIVWMYYFRGPIDIETRGYVSKTLKEVMVQPTDIEKYTLQHFHNLDKAVLEGIQYSSTCVTCHGDYPHSKTAKVRAFYNAHSWFIACEACHSGQVRQSNVTFRWLCVDTDNELAELRGERGNYGARITPLRVLDGRKQRLDNLITEETVASYNLVMDDLDEAETKTAIDTMHQVLSQKPVTCDECHSESALFDFERLLYSPSMAKHLETIDVGTMVRGYTIFHFPDMYEHSR